MQTFTIVPSAAFDLRESAEFGFGGRDADTFDGTMRMAFVLDGYREQVGVTLRQDAADVRAVALRAEQAAGQPLIGGQLWGLPVLDGDMWADIAGATAITGKPAKTITSYLVRGKPKSNPFPQPSRFLGRNYWPVSVLTAWAAAATSSDAE